MGAIESRKIFRISNSDFFIDMLELFLLSDKAIFNLREGFSNLRAKIGERHAGLSFGNCGCNVLVFRQCLIVEFVFTYTILQLLCRFCVFEYLQIFMFFTKNWLTSYL